jgi:hypothetical protein
MITWSDKSKLIRKSAEIIERKAKHMAKTSYPEHDNKAVISELEILLKTLKEN